MKPMIILKHDSAASQVCNLRIFNQWKGRILLAKDREGVVRGKHGTMSIHLNGDLIQNDFSIIYLKGLPHN